MTAAFGSDPFIGDLEVTDTPDMSSAAEIESPFPDSFLYGGPFPADADS